MYGYIYAARVLNNFCRRQLAIPVRLGCRLLLLLFPSSFYDRSRPSITAAEFSVLRLASKQTITFCSEFSRTAVASLRFSSQFRGEAERDGVVEKPFAPGKHPSYVWDVEVNSVYSAKQLLILPRCLRSGASICSSPSLSQTLLPCTYLYFPDMRRK